MIIPRVKICGITSYEDAMHAAQAGADELGFNFYNASARYISPDDASRICDKIRAQVRVVGVFVNAEVENTAKIALALNLDAIQLHGDEDGNYIRQLRDTTDRKLIRAIRMRTAGDVSRVRGLEVDGILIDSYSASSYGGTGSRVDWDLASQICRSLPNVYLAGGLTPANVSRAIRKVRPHAVDVASGVEESPGKKDRNKVSAFIKEAKRPI